MMLSDGRRGVATVASHLFDPRNFRMVMSPVKTICIVNQDGVLKWMAENRLKRSANRGLYIRLAGQSARVIRVKPE